MKTLVILLIAKAQESEDSHGFMVILGVSALAILLIYLNRRMSRSIEKAANQIKTTMQECLNVASETLQKQTLVVDAFFKRLEEEEEMTPEEIKVFSVKMALCPASFFEDRKNDRYPSLTKKIAECLDGKWEEIFLGKKKHSQKEMEKIYAAESHR